MRIPRSSRKLFKGLILCSLGLMLMLKLEVVVLDSQKKNYLRSLFGDLGDHHKLDFETDEGYHKRLRLEDRILFASHIKKQSHVFNEREGYNESFLDSLPIIRNDIPDFCPKGCSNHTYKGSRMKISFVMNYHNELLSLLLRSIYTLLSAVPRSNFHELILVDDGSDLQKYHDLNEVEELVSTLLLQVRYVRFNDSKGLIFCRRYASEIASGDAVFILDSHIEVKRGFLEPLMAEVDKNYKTLAAPVFDFWDTFQMKYWSYDGTGLGFDRYMTWIFVHTPKTDKPFETPAILGGAFLASKRHLEEIDYFGRGMVGWGYENTEIALKTWMCDGRVLYVPCSRVLHYAAKRSPMNHGDRKKAESMSLNPAIIIKSYLSAEVYKDFELARPNIGEVMKDYEHVVVRNRKMIQNCNKTRDFSWLRRRLMPKIESFDGDTSIAATLTAGGKCVEVYEVINDQGQNENSMLLLDCPKLKAERNKMRLTKWNDLRIFGRRCLDWGYTKNMFSGCHNQQGNQFTRYDSETKRIQNQDGRLCLVFYNDSQRIERGFCDPDKMKAVKREYLYKQFEFRDVYHKSVLSGEKGVESDFGT